MELHRKTERYNMSYESYAMEERQDRNPTPLPSSSLSDISIIDRDRQALLSITVSSFGVYQKWIAQVILLKGVVQDIAYGSALCL